MIKNVGIVINNSKAKAQAFAETLKEALTQLKVGFWVDYCSGNCSNLPKPDLIFVLGGDGTLLRAFNKFRDLDIPFLSINFGRIGFLSALEPEQALLMLPQIIQGSYTTEEKLIISVSVHSEHNGKVMNDFALNEAVIRSTVLKLTKQRISINDNFVCEMQGDGLICATPTGSFAYSLSAGGSIIDTNLSAFSITPICSHSPSIRPLIISAEREIRIKCADLQSYSELFVDGRQLTRLFHNDLVIINKAPCTIKLVKFAKDDFFTSIYKKINCKNANVIPLQKVF